MDNLLHPDCAGLLALLPDAAIAADEAGRVRQWNPAAAILYGLPAEEALGRPLADIAPLPPAPDGGDVWRGPARHRRGDGAPLDVDVSVRALPGGCIAIVRPRAAAEPDAGPAEQALRERSAELQIAHDVAGLGTWRYDFPTRAASADARARAQYGVEDGPISADVMLGHIHPDDRERVVLELRAALSPAGPGRLSSEHRVVHPDGAVRWLALHMRVVDAGPGQPATRAYGVTQDITARKLVESAVQAAYREAQAHAARLESLLANAPLGISLLDADLRFQHINPRLAEINGIPREAHIGRTIRELMPDIAAAVDPIYRRVIATGRAVSNVEIVGVVPSRPDDVRTWMVNYFPVRAPGGAMLGAGAVVIDVTDQRRLERAIQAEHEQLATILETLDEGVIAFRPDGVMLLFNGAAQRQLGWDGLTVPETLSAFVASRSDRLFDAEGRELTPEEGPVSRLVRGEPYRDQLVRMVSPAGVAKWFSFTGAQVRGADGEVTLSVVSAREVTAERRAELELRESRQNLSELMDSTDGAIWSVDSDMRLLVGNASFRHLCQAIFGRELRHGERVLIDEVPGVLPADLSGSYRRALAGERFTVIAPIEVRGEVRMFESRLGPMRAADGEIRGATVFVRDVTERLRAERALRETERKLSTVFEMLPVGVSVTDTSGALAYANPAMERIMHLDREGLERRTYAARPHVRTDGAPMPPDQFAGARALRERRPVMDVEAGFTAEDGAEVWVSSSAVPVDFPDWQIVVVMADITARIRAQLALRESAAALSQTNAELTRALQLKDEFLAMISHELRTPLNTILGIAELLGEGTYGPLADRQRTALERVEQSGRHLLGILSDILDLTRLGAGAVHLDRAPVAVDALCMAALRQVAARAEKRRITLLHSVVFGADGLRADERRLTQILINLLDNAVKFTPEGGTVGLKVRADRADEQISFTVWDTGIGIAPEDMGRLFKPFTQVDGRLARAYEGVGLGLTLVRRLTELHGGSVSVESEPGKGSRFTVALPWTPEENAVPAPHAAPGPPGWARPPRVLLVDDDDVALDMYAAPLAAHGCAVAVARTGREALAQVEAHRPDVVVLDVQLPELDGLSVTRRLRADPATAAIPVLAVTALAMPGDRERCLEAGVTRYMAKPVGARALERAIAEVLADSEG